MIDNYATEEDELIKQIDGEDIEDDDDESIIEDEMLGPIEKESHAERSAFLDNIRMEIHDEGAKNHCKQNFLFASAAGRITSVLRLEPNFANYVPTLLKDVPRLQRIISAVNPEELESWIEFHNSHSPIGFLTTVWTPPKETNPIFMMRKFQYDVENSSQYIVSWFGNDMKNCVPLGKAIQVNYVQRGKINVDTPVHVSTKKSALAMSALLLTALAYKVDNSIIPEKVATQETLSSLLPESSAKDSFIS